ncbi:piggyBac transposable element-derived protein 4-like [Leptopilina heterotoma]|uniref:piggyBac transposable element-derived protein 4-like n=1 Tax=Leptopilina heterotoma TaxID=63436 RepID=UPI001CA90EBD|nr:piggyBac transposable element-derived protein 4-like [Leptopilina heterotoma]
MEKRSMKKRRMERRRNWSSGESEPEEIDAANFDITDLNIEDPNSWSAFDIIHDSHFYPSVKDFSGTSKISENVLLEGNEPIDYFQWFFDIPLLQLIVTESNRYQIQNPEPYHAKMKAWEPLTVEELRKFLALSILMGHARKGNLKDYWSTDPLLSTPIFREVMTRNRYLQILKYIHFQDNEEITDHPLKKVEPIIDYLQDKFSNTIIPGKNLCIDESLLLWKGRLKFKQYLPLKRNRFGIKLFELVDCQTGFILNFIVYTGENTDYKKFGLGITGDIVAHFLKPYFGKGHVVYVDNWYSSAQLAEFLHDRDTGLCGTVKSNRKGLPKMESKLQRGEVEAAHTVCWLLIKWMDKKEVYMITTVHELDFCATGKKNFRTNEDIVKPTCVVEYNRNMGGIDNIDRQLSLTESVRKSMKWYRKLFFHLMDLALTAAYSLYKMNNEYLSFPKFRLEVIRSILGISSFESIPRHSGLSRLTGNHFPKLGNSDRRCQVCSLKGTRKRTKYYCSTSTTALCVTPCFEKYHRFEILG